MHVSSGRAHMLVSNHRGRGQDPVTVLGRTKSLVTVKAMADSIREAAAGFHPLPSIAFPRLMPTRSQKLAVALAFVAAALSLAAVVVRAAREGALDPTMLVGGLLMLALGIGGCIRLRAR